MYFLPAATATEPPFCLGTARNLNIKFKEIAQACKIKCWRKLKIVTYCPRGHDDNLFEVAVSAWDIHVTEVQYS